MGKLAKTVYAEALFSLAGEREETDSLMEEMKALRAVFAENADFNELMTHPQITESEKKALLKEAFEGRVSETMMGFLELMTEKNHFSELTDTFDEYEALVYQKHHIGIAHVTSAMELTKTQKAQIHKKLMETTSFAEVREQYETDPSLIGGIVIRIGDRVVDGSVRHRLDRLTRELNSVRLVNE